MEDPMSVGLLTFPQMRDFHDLLGQRPLSLFMVLGWDQLVLTPLLYGLYFWIWWRGNGCSGIG